ncbi:MAG: molybdopterin molybdotransferase [Chloroflexota bacterium]|jgi:molybdopterin molybdotransferase|nr:molybdopterin molybdotransferase [Chloroflexota bacterium]
MPEMTLLRLEDARDRILAGVTALPIERVPLRDALGRVLAEPVISQLTLPPWDNSAMDGFAVQAADVAGASHADPRELRVVGEVAAGHAPDVSVGEGTAVRVLTGGMLPEGADAVVPVEDTDAPEGVAALPERVSIRQAVMAGAHVRRRGSDLEDGDRLVEAGTALGPAALAVIAAAGHGTVCAYRRPRLAVLATGDELVTAGEPVGPAQIPDSNSVSIGAQAAEAGAEVIPMGVASDRIEDILERLASAIAQADVVVATGGVSVGAHDLVKAAFERLGTLQIWRVAIQPGKPLAYAMATRPDGTVVHLFGLPGNPVSSFVTFELFVRPVLRRMSGHTDLTGRLTVRARLAEPFAGPAGRRRFLRVRLARTSSTDDGWTASLAGGQGSHVLSALANADGLAIVPEEVESQPAGSIVDVIRLDEAYR